MALPILCFSQYEKDAKLLYLGPSDITIGSINGIHPNLANYGFGNYVNGDVRQSFRIKGVPLKFVGHVSNEELRIGKPNYFRLSYDALTAKRLSKFELGELQMNTQSELKAKLESLYKLEGELSYKREMLSRLKLGHPIPELKRGLQIPSFDSISAPEFSLPKAPNLELPGMNSSNVPNLTKIDSLQLELLEIKDNISSAKGKIDSLEANMDKLKNMSMSSYLPERFKLRRLNIGLTSLSSGGLSKNAIPIHGVHAEGVYRETFYDVSAGMTQPFQNFSSEVFNQLTSNTQNVFNLDQFFNANKMRLVTSSVLGYGDKYRSNIKVEHFYSGKSWESIKKRESEATANTLNLSGNYNRGIIENLDVGFLAGITMTHNDSLQSSSGTDANIAYRGTAKYKFERIKGALEGEYRSLGSNYDGSSQGVLINGTTHKMLGYTQKIGRFSSVGLRYMEDSFSKTDSIVLFNSSKRLVSMGNIRINRENKLQGSYSLILGSGDEVKNRKGHLGTLMYVNEIRLGKNRMTNIAQGGYTIIPVRLSNQEIIHGSITSQFRTEKLTYSLKGSYEEYKGIELLWGKNYILEPQITYKGKMGEISFAYQYCRSDQFDEDHGVVLNANFTPSKFLSWQVRGQKWLEKERNFFFIQAPTFVAPWYFDIRVILHLNVKK